MAGRKIFVGSLPDGSQADTIRSEFSRYGTVQDIFVKQNCESGRQWAFVTFSSPEEAQLAKDSADRTLMFPGALKACDVMVAKNQGKFGQAGEEGGAIAPVLSGLGGGGAKKIFCGSLPDSITEQALRDEFCKYGTVLDVFVKMGNAPNKQWAFITFASGEEAHAAKNGSDKTLNFPGSERPCEVMIARNQGMHGQDPVVPAPDLTAGPVKVFVGSLPDNVSETLLRSEFSRFGQITDVYLKLGCEPGKQWAFITFGTHAQANQCKDQADRVMVVPGAAAPVEVMFARNQGKNGQNPLAGAEATAGVMPAGIFGMPGGALAAAVAGIQMAPHAMANGGWITYYTPAGLAYYHNHATGKTQWDAPAEMQLQATMGAQAAQLQQLQLQAQPMQQYGAALNIASQPQQIGPY